MSRFLLFVAVVLVLSGCASAAVSSSVDTVGPNLKGDPAALEAVVVQSPPESPEPPLPKSAEPSLQPTGPSAFAAGITSLGQAPRLDELTDTQALTPVSIDLPSLDVSGAPISAVGVEANGDMEIPGAEEVGWYRFGPTPGDDGGSAVLAAHIAFDGKDGVFRDLSDMEPGDQFAVGLSDGSSRSFVVIGLQQYSKTEIPLEDFFSRSGTPRLILITCGGTFNRQLRSYDDNVVVVAVPLDFLLAGDGDGEQDQGPR